MKTYNPKYSQRTIYVGSNDIIDVNKAISRLKHMSGPILKEIKMKRYFEPAGVKRRRKLKESISRTRARRRKAEMYR